MNRADKAGGGFGVAATTSPEPSQNTVRFLTRLTIGMARWDAGLKLEWLSERWLAPDQAVVPVCLKAEQLYNVAESLAPALLQAVPEAQRVEYLRCLRQFHHEEYW